MIGIHLFCDKYAGQNSNCMMLIMLSFAIKNFHFREFTINNLDAGDSENENDTAHSVIEKITRRSTIHFTNWWHAAIDMSFKKNNVEDARVGHNDIKNFKDSVTLYPYCDILTKPAVEEPGMSKEKSKVM